MKIDARDEARLRAKLEAAQEAGLLQRKSERNPHLRWRFDGPGLVIKGYQGKKGDSLVTDPPGLEREVLGRDLDELREMLVVDAVPGARGRACRNGRIEWIASREDVEDAQNDRDAEDAENAADATVAIETERNGNQTTTEGNRTATEGNRNAKSGYGMGTTAVGHGSRGETERRRSPGKRIAPGDLSADQQQVYRELKVWCQDRKGRLITLGGYAGTGKSTLVAVLAREVLAGRRVAFCAYAGKAGNVLRQKLAAAGADLAETYCGTIHGLIYRAEIDPETGALLGFRRVEDVDANLVVVDESSMVGRDIFSDLQSFGVKILAVGDHGQLPPVGGDHINLMERPDLRLERIHRQAQGNPILSLAELVRGGGDPREFAPAEAGSIQGTQERDHGRGRGRVRIVRGLDLAEVHQAFGVGPAGSAPLEAGPSRGGRFGGRPLEAAVLCYKNRTRVWLNQRIREGLGHRRELVPGDVVICLRNVTVDSVRLFNGMRGLVQAVRPEGEHHLRTDIFFPDDGLRLRDGRLLRHQLGRPYTFADFPSIAKVTGSEVRSWDEAGLLFDHGYALTVHKSQGSQFCRVVLVAEPGLPGDAPAKRARWLYTGVTRASEQLSVLIP